MENSTPAKMTIEIVNPVVAATSTTFRNMIGCDCSRAGLETMNKRSRVYEINATIDLEGLVRGRFWLSFPQRTARVVAARMLSETVDAVKHLAEDTVGELANNIVGLAKSDLERLRLELGTPLILEPAAAWRFPAGAVPMRIDFRSEIGPFFIAFGFVEGGAAEALEIPRTSGFTDAQRAQLDTIVNAAPGS